MLKKVHIRTLNWLEENTLIAWILVIFIAIFIFYMSSLTSDPTPYSFSLKPYVYHFFIFGILAFFLSIAMTKGKNNNKNLLFLVLIISIIYAISDELHQLFVPNRSCSLNDVIMDSIGALCAIIVYSIKNKSF